MTDEIQDTIGIQVLLDGHALGEVYDPAFPGAKGDLKDTTAQNNIGGIKSKLVGLIEYDDFTFKVHYNGSAAQETLIAEIFDREVHQWEFVLPPDFHAGGHSFTFTGQIHSTKRVLTGDGPGHIEISSTVTTKPLEVTTWAAGLTTPFFAIVENDSNPLTPVPAAAAAVYEYQLEAYADNTYIKITPTATVGTIHVQDVVVATGVQSGQITINTGARAVTMVSIVVSELAKTPKVYWIRLYLGDTNHP